MTQKASAGYCISVSQGNHAEDHSRREYTPKSAARSLSADNVTLYDCGDDREHFNEFFRDSIEAYNAKQRRKDRRKSLDYLGAIESGEACYGKGEKAEKPYYHDVIQIGDHEANGVTDAEFDPDHWRELKKTDPAAADQYAAEHRNTDPIRAEILEILQEIGNEIVTNKDGRYSRILVHGAVIHRDEPAGTDHLDLRYTIWTEDTSGRGPSRRVSMNKGLKEMGYKLRTETTTDPETGQPVTRQVTALEQFREDIKARIAEKMEERGLTLKIKGEHRKHLTPAEYIADQQAKTAAAQAAQAEEAAEDAIAAMIQAREAQTAAEEAAAAAEADRRADERAAQEAQQAPALQDRRALAAAKALRNKAGELIFSELLKAYDGRPGIVPRIAEDAARLRANNAARAARIEEKAAEIAGDAGDAYEAPEGRRGPQRGE